MVEQLVETFWKEYINASEIERLNIIKTKFHIWTERNGLLWGDTISPTLLVSYLNDLIEVLRG